LPHSEKEPGKGGRSGPAELGQILGGKPPPVHGRPELHPGSFRPSGGGGRGETPPVVSVGAGKVGHRVWQLEGTETGKRSLKCEKGTSVGGERGEKGKKAGGKS